MGTLSLPASGRVYVDTQIIIYTVERHPVYEPIVQSLWSASQAGTVEIFSSELTLLETLVGPLKVNDVALQADYEQALTGTEIRLVPLSREVLRTAARLRAAIPSLRTPDALHAATALEQEIGSFLTNDRAFRRVTGLDVILLDDLRIAS